MPVEPLRALAERHGVELRAVVGQRQDHRGAVRGAVRADLVRPTFVTGHPVEISPLARVDRNDPVPHGALRAVRRRARAGQRLLRAQRSRSSSALRFEEEQAPRTPATPRRGTVDEDYLRALEYGMPPTGGLGIGMDRVAMLLAGVDSIQEVILFPTLRPGGRLLTNDAAMTDGMGRRLRDHRRRRRGARHLVSAGSAGASSATSGAAAESTSQLGLRDAATSLAASTSGRSGSTIDVDAAPASPADVYLRLHLLSHRLAPPRSLNLDGIFGAADQRRVDRPRARSPSTELDDCPPARCRCARARS